MRTIPLRKTRRRSPHRAALPPKLELLRQKLGRQAKQGVVSGATGCQPVAAFVVRLASRAALCMPEARASGTAGCGKSARPVGGGGRRPRASGSEPLLYSTG